MGDVDQPPGDVCLHTSLPTHLTDQQCSRRDLLQQSLSICLYVSLENEETYGNSYCRIQYGKTRTFHLQFIFADEANPLKLKASKIVTLLMM